MRTALHRDQIYNENKRMDEALKLKAAIMAYNKGSI